MLLRSLIVAGSLGVLALVVWVAGAHAANQWDFRTSYSAAASHAAGGNPYEQTTPAQGGLEVRAGYAYPPNTLTYFRAFTPLAYRTAAWVHLGLKCVVLVGLVLLWRRAFLRNEFSVWFLPFTLLAFNGATCTDLVSGNVQLFELALLWLAFACYARGWDLLFGVLIFAAASLRVFPIVFLGLYLLAGRGRWVLAILGGGMFLAALFAVNLVNPKLFASFVRAVIAVREEGWNSPALWPLLQGVRTYLSLLFGKPVPNWTAVTTYFLLLAGVAAVTVVVGLRIMARTADEMTARRLQVYLACFAYVLVVPHLRPSGYMLLLVPTFYLLRRSPPLHAGIVLGLMAVIPANPLTGIPYLAPLGVIMTEYYLWIAAVVFWVLFCVQYFNGGDAGTSANDSSLPAPGTGGDLVQSDTGATGR